MSREEELRLQVVVDATDADKLDEIADQTQRLDGEDVSIPVGVEGTESAISDVDRLSSAMDGLSTDNRKWIDEIRAGAAELHTTAAQTGQVLESAGAQSAGGLEKTATAARNAKGELGNVAGNAAGDLLQVAGVSGTTANALGNLAEQAIAGGSAMAAMGPAAAVAVGASVAMWAINRDAKKAADALKKAREELDKIAGATDADVLKLFDDALLKTALNGGDLNQFLVDFATNNTEAAKRTLEAAEASGKNEKVTRALADAIKEAERAQAQETETKKKYGKQTEETTAETEKNTEAINAGIEALQREAEASRDAADAMLERNNALREGVDSSFALHDAEQQFDEALSELPQKLKDAKGNLEEVRGALDETALSAAAVADANLEMANQLFAAQGVTLTATQQMDAWNQSMLTQAATAKGPARDAILNYIASVNGIPPEKLTEIIALMDQGKIDEANRVLAETSESREATVTAVAQTSAAEAELRALANKQFWANIKANVIFSSAQGMGGNAISAGQPGRSAGTTIQNFNVTLPAGARQADVSAALSRHTRRSGGRWGGTRRR